MRMSLTDVGLASWLNSPLCQRGAGGDFPLFIEGVAHLGQLQIPPAPFTKGGVSSSFLTIESTAMSYSTKIVIDPENLWLVINIA